MRVSPGARGEKGDRKQARKARRDARRGPEAAPAPLATPEQLQAVNARPIGEQRVWVRASGVSCSLMPLSLVQVIMSMITPRESRQSLGVWLWASSVCTGIVHHRLLYLKVYGQNVITQQCRCARRCRGRNKRQDPQSKMQPTLQGYEARKAEAASKAAAAAAAPAETRLQEAADAAAEADTAEAATEAANIDAALAEGGADAEDAEEAGASGGDTNAQRLQLLDAMTVSSATHAQWHVSGSISAPAVLA